jgi:trk system potassium uptake protein TrkH
MGRLRAMWRLSRVQAVVLGYLLLILLGSGLLLLPAAQPRTGASFLDCLFTATSAVTLTGLVTISTTAWAPLGKLIILVLIQLGGLAYMTIGTIFALLLGLRLGLRTRLLQVSEGLGSLRMRDALHIVPYVALVAIGLEALGAVALGLRFAAAHGMTIGQATYTGIFYAVSAFCNAGFNLLPGGLATPSYRGDLWLLVILGVLITLGGLGFGVLMELALRRKVRLSLRARLVLVTSLVLMLVGLGLVYLFEWGNGATLGAANQSWLHRLVTAWFMSVTARTAGFSPIDLNAMSPPSLFVLALLMMIGASPDGTGGGVKTTTVAVIVLAIFALLRRRADIEVFGRRIGGELVRLALSLVSIYLIAILLVILAISFTEINLKGLAPGAATMALYGKLMLEVVSAFSTGGLSAGITPTLSPFSRLLIIISMFLGRVGPLVFAYLFAQPRLPQLRRLPVETVTPG